jgi:putative pyruvate formate lyase activating enzyme
VALIEMKRQVGQELLLDQEGLAWRGMIVRHMVLPQGLSQTPDVLEWVAQHLGNQMHLSLMSQYFPAHEAVTDDLLCRGLTEDEYEAALDVADRLGFERGWRQELELDAWAER